VTASLTKHHLNVHTVKLRPVQMPFCKMCKMQSYMLYLTRGLQVKYAFVTGKFTSQHPRFQRQWI